MQKIQTFSSFCKRKEGEGMNVFIGLKKNQFFGFGQLNSKITLKNLVNHSKFTNRIFFF